MSSGFKPMSLDSLPKVASVGAVPAPVPAAGTPPANPSAASQASSRGFAPLSSRAHSGPSVSVQKDGDRITHIVVHCTCGETIYLECSY